MGKYDFSTDLNSIYDTLTAIIYNVYDYYFNINSSPYVKNVSKTVTIALLDLIQHLMIECFS